MGMKAFQMPYLDAWVLETTEQAGLNLACGVFDEHEMLAVQGRKSLLIGPLDGCLDRCAHRFFDHVDQVNQTQGRRLWCQRHGYVGLAALTVRRGRGGVPAQPACDGFGRDVVLASECIQKGLFDQLPG